MIFIFIFLLFVVINYLIIPWFKLRAEEKRHRDYLDYLMYSDEADEE